MKNRTENISVRYRPQHLTKSQNRARVISSSFFYFISNFQDLNRAKNQGQSDHLFVLRYRQNKSLHRRSQDAECFFSLNEEQKYCC